MAVAAKAPAGGSAYLARYAGERVRLDAGAAPWLAGWRGAGAEAFHAQGFPTSARDLTDPSTFRAGRSGADLYRRVAIGIPGTPMAAFLGGTGEHDPWDLVHYVRSLSDGPAG